MSERVGSTKHSTHRITLKIKLVLLIGAFLFAGTSPTHAHSRFGLQIASDFAQHFNYSAKDARYPGNGGFDRLIYRDLGFSWRPRLSILLAERHGRPLDLLIGAYVRNPVIMSFTNYGSTISSPFGLEFGGDIGVGWFGFARTLVSFSPEYVISHTTSDFGSPATFSARHWSAGLRLEVPIFFLESDPGDLRVEFGPMATYAADRIRSIRVKSETDPSINTSLANTQGVSFRWLLGVYMNVRI